MFNDGPAQRGLLAPVFVWGFGASIRFKIRALTRLTQALEPVSMNLRTRV
jgi:hypothetical protein